MEILGLVNRFTVTIDKVPRVIGKYKKIKNSDIELIKDWVKLNYTSLIKYWNMTIDIGELIKELKSI